MIHRINPLVLVGTALLVGVACFAPPANAVSTRHFLLDDAGSLSAGELEATAVTSDGSVIPSVETRRLEIENVPVARCLLRAPDGSVYIGTGNKGKIFRLRGDKLSPFAETGQLLVTALARTRAGTLYAGTLPKGKIFTVGNEGEVKEFAAPEDAEHIWSLVYDEKRRTLFAATGPEGKVFAIDGRGKAEVYHDADAAHVMTLALDGDGSLYAGTSDEALLLRLRGPGRAEVVYDLPGNEVTAIAVRQGRVAAVANDFPKKPSSRSEPKKKDSSTDTSKSPPKKPATTRTVTTPRIGKGAVWYVRDDGRAERLFHSEKSYLTRVQWAGDDVIYAAAGKEGRVYRIQTDGTHATWIDVDERQVLDMDLASKEALLVTGDGGAVYRVLPGKPRKALWTSDALDARFRSRWGKITWRGSGRLSFQTRSGNTEKPDDSWSAWSTPLERPGPVRSPAARFLQVRARLSAGGDPILYAVTAYYLPQNQNTVLKEIGVEPRSGKPSTAKRSSRSKPSARGDEPPAPTTVYQVDWKTDNPDGDELRFRLRYRSEGQKIWRHILKESETLTKTRYEWDTEGIPDGYYRIRVDASDELANPARYALQTSEISEPFLIDNHPPRLEGLRAAGKRVQGIARDEAGPIARLEYAVDGGDWLPFFPVDDLLDSAEERFDLKLEDLKPGPHIIAVRVTDAAGNTGVSEVTAR
jgi:hypothetical protein